jgi:hypothetical protein
VPDRASGSSYNRRQEEVILVIRDHLVHLPGPEKRALRRSLEPYLEFRSETASFQDDHLSAACTLKCFHDGTSACCGREGILTFFADVVINVLLSTDVEVEALLSLLSRDRGGPNCVYLGEGGCAWNLKPVTCEMFLCNHAKKEILNRDISLGRRWEELRKREKSYTFPDRPVLFDGLEKLFLDAGIEDPMMYCHKSPGLLLLKKKHGVG